VRTAQATTCDTFLTERNDTLPVCQCPCKGGSPNGRTAANVASMVEAEDGPFSWLNNTKENMFALAAKDAVAAALSKA
jgi:hypothetical protein